MARLKYQTLKYQTSVAASPEELFELVTGYPIDGQVRGEDLQDKYGEFLSGEGPSFTFRQNIGGGVTWECWFDPPSRRIMRALDSSWSDRIDHFVPTPQGTLWLITWEVKARGAAVLTKWLAFNLFGKRTVGRKVVRPVLRDLYRSKQNSGQSSGPP